MALTDKTEYFFNMLFRDSRLTLSLIFAKILLIIFRCFSFPWKHKRLQWWHMLSTDYNTQHCGTYQLKHVVLFVLSWLCSYKVELKIWEGPRRNSWSALSIDCYRKLCQTCFGSTAGPCDFKTRLLSLFLSEQWALSHSHNISTRS